MNDARADDKDQDEPAGPDLDAHDDAVMAADDTGMLAGERLITIAETEEPLRRDADPDA